MNEGLKKIVILDHEPYSERKFKHYYFREFLTQGIVIEYWDVHKVLESTSSINYNYGKDTGFVRVISGMDKLTRDLGKLNSKNTILVMEVPFHLDSLRIYQFVNRFGLKWCKINYYHNPTNYLNPIPTFGDKVIKAFDLKRLIRYLRYKRLERYKYLAKPHLLFLTGNENSEFVEKTISLNFFDVEDYNNHNWIEKPSLVQGNYIVFLDIMFASHPDFQRYKISTLPEEKYFSKMNRFFDKLEQDLKMPVIIASHPKANYTNEFAGRKIIVGETMSLVNHAKMVVTHGSLSISFALLAQKPLLYVYFDDMLKSVNMRFYYKRMVKATQELGAMLVNIDTFSSLGEFPSVNLKLYEEFLEKVYLKENSETKANFEIIRDNLSKLIQTT